MLDTLLYVESLKGFQQAFSGVNHVTGGKLPTSERWSEGIGSALSLFPVPCLKHAGKYGTDGVVSLWRKLDLQFFARKDTVKPVSNMNEFFDMRFGKLINNSLTKSKVKYDGQSIYKVTQKTDNPYLKKGYGVYLDALHKDRLEVIDKKVRYYMF